MIKISRSEADVLRDNGFSQYIRIASITHKSKAKSYYAVEDPKVKKVLRRYREDRIIKED